MFPGTSLADAIANTLAAAKVNAKRLNDNLIVNFTHAWETFAFSRMNGFDNIPAPVPAKSWLPSQNPDGTWTVAQLGPPVCEIPLVPEVAKPYVPPVIPPPDDILQAPADDMMPLGYVYVAPDGKKWQKMSSPTPFGVTYFYRVVA